MLIFSIFFRRSNKRKKFESFLQTQHFENMHVILIILIQARITSPFIKKKSIFCFEISNIFYTFHRLSSFDHIRGASLTSVPYYYYFIKNKY